MTGRRLIGDCWQVQDRSAPAEKICLSAEADRIDLIFINVLAVRKPIIFHEKGEVVCEEETEK